MSPPGATVGRGRAWVRYGRCRGRVRRRGSVRWARTAICIPTQSCSIDAASARAASCIPARWWAPTGSDIVWDGAAHRKIPQIGIVRIEDDVEIGANSTIDRATLGETVIGRGTKIDNLVQIGHNVVIGEHAIICGQTGIGGSARVGNRVTLAGQVGVSDHAWIPDGVTATGQAGIFAGAHIPSGQVVSGMPAAPHREFLKRSAWVARLPELAQRLARLEEQAGGRGKGD